MPDCRQQSPISGLYQLAYVTTDVERAVHECCAQYGIPEFRIVDAGLLPLEPAGQSVHILCALAWHRGLQIEIIQPLAGTCREVYAAPLPAEGYGFAFHHLGFAISGDLDDWQAFRAAIDPVRTPIVIEGKLRTSRWIYTDQACLGVMPLHEHCWYDEEGQALMTQIPGWTDKRP